MTVFVIGLCFGNPVRDKTPLVLGIGFSPEVKQFCLKDVDSVTGCIVATLHMSIFTPVHLAEELTLFLCTDG